MSKSEIRIDPKPLFDLSPYLYMQFMEPLGVTDSSVEGAWDWMKYEWLPDVIAKTRDLAPTLMRYGGIFSAYYRWREGVGPRDKRVPMLNHLWGGIETNQIGTAEFCEFCELVGADKFYCVNFLSEGKEAYARTPDGKDRSAGPDEAAEWLDYCNNPDNAERIFHGRKQPYNVKLWQLGNETSYNFWGNAIDVELAAKRTVDFAKAMRKVDPSIDLIGWGDDAWGPRMLDVAGEHLQYIAAHIGPASRSEPNVLRDNDYRKDWARTWEQLMESHQPVQEKISKIRQEVAGYDTKLAITEGHFGLRGRNRCEVLSSWAAGVANARTLNVHERNGDFVKIATLADFCGNRWMVNALYIQLPNQTAHLMPVGYVMSLYRKHVGKQEIAVKGAPAGLDITASRDGDTVYLHVINTEMKKSVKTDLAVDGYDIISGKIFELCQEPDFEVMITTADQLTVQEKDMGKDSEWTFPAASVSAVELKVKAKN